MSLVHAPARTPAVVGANFYVKGGHLSQIGALDCVRVGFGACRYARFWRAVGQFDCAPDHCGEQQDCNDFAQHEPLPSQLQKVVWFYKGLGGVNHGVARGGCKTVSNASFWSVICAGGSEGVRRNVPVIVTARINALLHRVLALTAWIAQREPQHTADEFCTKHNRGEGYKRVFAHIPSFVIQMPTPEGARHV